MPYEFTQDGFKQFSEAVIGAGGDQATLTTLLADMQGTYETSIGSLAKALKDVETTKEENDRLRKANMDLFLRIGAHPEDKPPQTAQPEGGKMNCAEYMAQYFEKEGKK